MLGILKYLGVLLLCTLGVGQTYLYHRVKKRWNSLPTVAAEIIESQLLDHNDMDGRRTYEAIIRYRYDFRGKEYVSETPTLKSPQLFPDKNFEHELLAKYKVGELVNAKVLPGTPKVAYLEVEPFSRISAIGVPILLVLYVVAVFGYGWMVTEIFNYDPPDRYYEPPSNM